MTLLDLALPYQRRVLESKSAFKVLNFSRQTGKSWCCGFLAAYTCCRKKNALVVYLSTGQRAADEALKTCRKFAEAVKTVSKGGIAYSFSATCITFSNGSRIISLPGNPNSTRGWTVDLLICDELAFWQNPEETWQGIAPVLTNELAGGDKRLIVASTPFSKNSLFYDLCQKARSGEHGWEYFETTIHQAVEQGLKADVQKLHELVPDPRQFAAEFECQFLDGAGQLLDASLLQAVDDIPGNLEWFLGGDWARTKDGSALVAVGRAKDGKLYLADIDSFRNMEYAEQIGRATKFFRKYDPKEMLGDAGGLGGPLMEQLNRTVSARIKGFTFTQQNKTDCYEYFRKVVFDRKFFVRRDLMPQLVQDVQLVQQTISENGKTTYTAMRVDGSHADICSALVLALNSERNHRANASLPAPFAFQSRI